MSGHIDRMDGEMSELMRDQLIASGVDPAEVARSSDEVVLARIDESHPGGAWGFVEEHGGEVIQVHTVAP
jgi:hypothetical protein